MIRLLLRLFNIRDYEICQSCQTLKQQLEYERAEKTRLTDTLLNIISPKVIEAAPIELQPISQSSGVFSRRRVAAEERDRQEASLLKTSKHLGRPDNLINVNRDDSILKLETELNIEKAVGEE
jgi:hypothetical protein